MTHGWGNYPQSTYSGFGTGGLTDNALRLTFGGEVAYHSASNTSVDMGSGRWPGEGYGRRRTFGIYTIGMLRMSRTGMATSIPSRSRTNYSRLFETMVGSALGKITCSWGGRVCRTSLSQISLQIPLQSQCTEHSLFSPSCPLPQGSRGQSFLARVFEVPVVPLSTSRALTTTLKQPFRKACSTGRGCLRSQRPRHPDITMSRSPYGVTRTRTVPLMPATS